MTTDPQALVTLPGEPEFTLDESLEAVLAELTESKQRLRLASLSVEDARNALLDFQHIARGGAPRPAASIEGVR